MPCLGKNMGAAIDLVVLAGGAATRLGPLAGQGPKALLPVHGRPFLTWPLARIAGTIPLGRVFISARAGQAQAFHAGAKMWPHETVILEETAPMGTGGAILAARAHAAPGNPFLVLNGDVYFNLDAGALVQAALRHGAALSAIAVPDSRRFGRLDIVAGRVRAFVEKMPAPEPTPGLVNAGLYAFCHESLAGFPCRPCAFEHEIAPVLAAMGVLGAVTASGPFLDIGTPEAYARAETLIENTALCACA